MTQDHPTPSEVAERLERFAEELRPSAEQPDEGDGWQITDKGREVRAKDQERAVTLRTASALVLSQAGEIERLREGHEIVARIWALFGSPSYEELAGRSIYDLITASQSRAERLEAALKPFAEAAERLRPDDADTMRPAIVQAKHFREARSALQGDGG